MHRAVYHGHKVLIKMRDGRKIVDHFEDARSKYVVLRQCGRINYKDMKTLTLWKAQVRE